MYKRQLFQTIHYFILQSVNIEPEAQILPSDTHVPTEIRMALFESKLLTCYTDMTLKFCSTLNKSDQFFVTKVWSTQLLYQYRYLVSGAGGGESRR